MVSYVCHLTEDMVDTVKYISPDPGFMPSSIVAEINLGAGRPGMSAVVMIISLSDTHLAIAVA